MAGRIKKIVADDTAAAAAEYARLATEKKVAFYRTVVEQDYQNVFYTDEQAALLTGGLAAGRASNEFMRQAVRDFKERAQRRIDEYEAKGYLEGYPPDYPMNRVSDGN
ncbi:hypothetical protein ACP70R_005404 [Stipagrostis hirtigluma subsp. patula]